MDLLTAKKLSYFLFIGFIQSNLNLNRFHLGVTLLPSIPAANISWGFIFGYDMVILSVPFNFVYLDFFH